MRERPVAKARRAVRGDAAAAAKATQQPQLEERPPPAAMAVPAKSRHPAIIHEKKRGAGAANGGLIGEAAYIELMKNCSKWNTRIVSERKTRYPVYDAQTSTVHKPTVRRKHLQVKSKSSFTGPALFPARRWKKSRTAATADAVELKHFLHHNEPLNAAIAASSGQSSSTATSSFTPLGGSNQGWQKYHLFTESSVSSMDMTPERNGRGIRPNYVSPRESKTSQDDDELDDEDDFFSDDDDAWGAKKNKNKGKRGVDRSVKKKPHWTQQQRTPMPPQQHTPMNRAQQPPMLSSTPQSQPPPPTSTQSSSNTTSPESKPFVCQHCGAKYKSRPGLNYHKAHVHADATSQQATPPAPATPTQTPSTPLGPSHLISPSVEVSDICDYCLGSRLENKNTSKPEQLVSCHDCGRSGHPSCLKFTENMIISTQKYGWQCIECKSCAICGTSDNDDQLLFCDDCDRGFHLYCLKPALKKPPEGEWSCHLCQRAFGAKASRPADGPTGAPAPTPAPPSKS